MSHNLTCDHCGKISDPFFHCSCWSPHDQFFHHGCGIHGHSSDCHCLVKDLCDDRFNIRLRGLDGGLPFRLRQLIGCFVKIETDCGDDCREFRAIICHVGRDFVEVERLDHHKAVRGKNRRRTKRKKMEGYKDDKNRFVIIPINEIKKINLIEDKEHC